MDSNAAEIRRLRADLDRSKPAIRLFASGDASLFALGTQIMSEVIAGVALGWGTDLLLGTHRRWIVVGSIAGVVVAMLTITRTAIKLSQRTKLPPTTNANQGETHDTDAR